MAHDAKKRLTLVIGLKLTNLVTLYKAYLEQKNGLRPGELCEIDIATAIMAHFFLKHGREIWPEEFTALPKSYLHKYGRALKNAALLAEADQLEGLSATPPRNPNLPEDIPSPYEKRSRARAKAHKRRPRGRPKRKLAQ